MAVRKILLCKILLKTSPTTPRKFPPLFFFLFFYVLTFGYNKRHSWRRFPHVKVFFLRQKKIAVRFFLASSTTRHRSLGRIDRGAHVTAVAASHTSEKKITPKQNRGAIFFGVIHYASQLAWTYRPWRSRHSRRRFPHVRKKIYAKKKSRSDFFLASSTARHSSLGRIDRNLFRIFFRKCYP